MSVIKRIGIKLFGTQQEKNTPAVVKVGNRQVLDLGENHIPGSNYGTVPAVLGGIHCHVYIDSALQLDNDGNVIGGNIVEDVV